MAKSSSIMDYNINFWNGVVYGPPGVGKTIMCGTSQKLKTYILDVDNGMSSLRAHIVRNGLRQDLVTIKRVQTLDDFIAGVSEMERLKPDILVLDSATELFRIIKRETAAANSHMTADQRDWGRILDIMEEFSADIRYKPLHFIMTAHEWTKVDPSLDLPVVRPSFQGRFAEEYAKHFSWIARYESVFREELIEGDAKKKEVVVKRRLNFGPHPQMHYKDRSGAMRRLEPPNIDHILETMIASTTATGSEQLPDDSDS